MEEKSPVVGARPGSSRFTYTVKIRPSEMKAPRISQEVGDLFR